MTTGRITLAAIALVTAAGCHAGMGPVLGIGAGGQTLGWEGSGGLALLRGAVGQAYGDSSLTYAVFDPGLPVMSENDHEMVVVGASIGFATLHESGATRFAWALWGGYVHSFQRDTFNACGDDMNGPYASATVGFRGAGLSFFEAFVAPKVGLIYISEEPAGCD